MLKESSRLRAVAVSIDSVRLVMSDMKANRSGIDGSSYNPISGIRREQYRCTSFLLSILVISEYIPIVLYKGANYTTLSLPSPSDLARFTHILLQNEIPFLTTLWYLTHSKSPALERPITTIYNPSPMPTPTQISYEIKWEHVDWLVVNEGEAQQLLDAFPAPSFVLSPETQLLGDSPSSALRSSRLISRLA